MERNVAGRYRNGRDKPYFVLDCRVCPFVEWGEPPATFNIRQNIGQLEIYFLAVEYAHPI